MPTGPKGEKRPADVIANAVRVMRIATGEEEETLEGEDGKDKAAQGARTEGWCGAGGEHDAGAAGGDRAQGGGESGGANRGLPLHFFVLQVGLENEVRVP